MPNGDHITIAELLEMRSGLYNYTDAPELSASLDRDPTKVWTPDEVLAIAFKQPPNFPPGTAFEYNNTNYVLLGLIAEELDDGKPLASDPSGPLVRAAGHEGHRAPRQHLEHYPRALLARLPVRQLLLRLGRRRITRPRSRPRPGPEHSSPTTTPA